MPDAVALCPGCGRAMAHAAVAHGTVGALPETIAGALAYFVVPAIVFLFVEPYRSNRFLRFHSFQSLGACFVGIVIGAALRVVGFTVFFIPVLGRLLFVLVSMVVSLAVFAVWVVLIVKALQGEMFKLPLVGDFAERQISAS